MLRKIIIMILSASIIVFAVITVSASDDAESKIIIALNNVPQNTAVDITGRLERIEYNDISPKADTITNNPIESPLYKYTDDSNIALCMRDNSIDFAFIENPQGQSFFHITLSDNIPDEIAVIAMSSDNEIQVSNYISITEGNTENLSYDYNTNTLIHYQVVSLSDLEKQPPRTGQLIFTGLIFVVLIYLIELLIDIIRHKKFSITITIHRIIINAAVYVALVFVYYYLL